MASDNSNRPDRPSEDDSMKLGLLIVQEDGVGSGTSPGKAGPTDELDTSMEGKARVEGILTGAAVASQGRKGGRLAQQIASGTIVPGEVGEVGEVAGVKLPRGYTPPPTSVDDCPDMPADVPVNEHDGSDTGVEKMPAPIAFNTALEHAEKCIPSGLESRNQRLLVERLCRMRDIMSGEGGPFKSGGAFEKANGNLTALARNVEFCKTFDARMMELNVLLGAKDPKEKKEETKSGKRKKRRNIFKGFATYLDENKGSETYGQQVIPDYAHKVIEDFVDPAHAKLLQLKEQFDLARLRVNNDTSGTQVFSQAVPNAKYAMVENGMVFSGDAGVLMREDTARDYVENGTPVVAPNFCVDDYGRKIDVSFDEIVPSTKDSAPAQPGADPFLRMAHFRVSKVKEEKVLVKQIRGTKPEAKEANRVQGEVLGLTGEALARFGELRPEFVSLEVMESVRACALFLGQLHDDEAGQWGETYSDILAPNWRAGNGFAENGPRIQELARLILVRLRDGFLIPFESLSCTFADISSRLQGLRTTVEDIAPVYEAWERVAGDEVKQGVIQRQQALLHFCAMELPRLVTRVRDAFLQQSSKDAEGAQKAKVLASSARKPLPVEEIVVPDEASEAAGAPVSSYSGSSSDGNVDVGAWCAPAAPSPSTPAARVPRQSHRTRVYASGEEGMNMSGFTPTGVSYNEDAEATAETVSEILPLLNEVLVMARDCLTRVIAGSNEDNALIAVNNLLRTFRGEDAFLADFWTENNGEVLVTASGIDFSGIDSLGNGDRLMALRPVRSQFLILLNLLIGAWGNIEREIEIEDDGVREAVVQGLRRLRVDFTGILSRAPATLAALTPAPSMATPLSAVTALAPVASQAPEGEAPVPSPAPTPETSPVGPAPSTAAPQPEAASLTPLNQVLRIVAHVLGNVPSGHLEEEQIKLIVKCLRFVAAQTCNSLDLPKVDLPLLNNRDALNKVILAAQTALLSVVDARSRAGFDLQQALTVLGEAMRVSGKGTEIAGLRDFCRNELSGVVKIVLPEVMVPSFVFAQRVTIPTPAPSGPIVDGVLQPPRPPRTLISGPKTIVYGLGGGNRKGSSPTTPVPEVLIDTLSAQPPDEVEASCSAQEVRRVSRRPRSRWVVPGLIGLGVASLGALGIVGWQQFKGPGASLEEATIVVDGAAPASVPPPLPPSSLSSSSSDVAAGAELAPTTSSITDGVEVVSASPSVSIDSLVHGAAVPATVEVGVLMQLTDGIVPISSPVMIPLASPAIGSPAQASTWDTYVSQQEIPTVWDMALDVSSGNPNKANALTTEVLSQVGSQLPENPRKARLAHSPQEFDRIATLLAGNQWMRPQGITTIAELEARAGRHPGGYASRYLAQVNAFYLDQGTLDQIGSHLVAQEKNSVSVPIQLNVSEEGVPSFQSFTMEEGDGGADASDDESKLEELEIDDSDGAADGVNDTVGQNHAGSNVNFTAGDAGDFASMMTPVNSLKLKQEARAKAKLAAQARVAQKAAVLAARRATEAQAIFVAGGGAETVEGSSEIFDFAGSRVAAMQARRNAVGWKPVSVPTAAEAEVPVVVESAVVETEAVVGMTPVPSAVVDNAVAVAMAPEVAEDALDDLTDALEDDGDVGELVLAEEDLVGNIDAEDLTPDEEPEVVVQHVEAPAVVVKPAEQPTGVMARIGARIRGVFGSFWKTQESVTV